MSENTAPQLPWDALRATKGHIPWPALEAFADALVADASLLQPIEDLYLEAAKRWTEQERYEDLYVPAILALAGPRLGDEARRQAAGFLLNRLSLAGRDDDDFALEALAAACGRLGPSILPQVLDAIRAEPDQNGARFHLWGLTELAADSTDDALRSEVAQACVALLQQAERDEVPLGDAGIAA